MKILGLSAGTKDGNNDAICKEALMGAAEQGAQIEFIRLLDLNIKHCTGCTACVKALMSGKGNLCVLKDDFDWLLDKMLDADGIVLASPIFENGTAGIVHTLTDRFGPRMDRGNNIIGTKIAESIGGKVPAPRILKDKVISFMGIGGSDWASLVQLDHAMLAMTPMWKVIDNDKFQWSKGILMNDRSLARARQIGVNLAAAAQDIENAQYMGEPGVCPHCQCNNFYIEPGTARGICCICGLQGELSIANGALKISYPEAQLPLAHDTVTGKFKHGEDIKRIQAEFAESQRSPEYQTRMNRYKAFIRPSQP